MRAFNVSLKNFLTIFSEKADFFLSIKISGISFMSEKLRFFISKSDLFNSSLISLINFSLSTKEGCAIVSALKLISIFPL